MTKQSDASASAQANKALVLKAMHELFVLRDMSAVQRYWAEDYKQHNPTIGDGLAGLAREAMKNPLRSDFRYEQGIAIAEGDLVMVHGRYTNLALNGITPQTLIAIDLVRVKDGKMVEHWDVMQVEVPAGETASGNPMFTPVE